MQTSLKTITATVLIGIGTLSSLSLPANAGWGCGWGCGWGSALAGFGIGAVVGSALVAPPVYAVPPYYYYYGPADYGYYYYGPGDYAPPDYEPRSRTPSWHGTPPYPRAKAPSHGVVLPTAKTNGPASSEKKIETRFRAAQAKAKREGVDALTKQDIEGLNSAQLKQLRGY
jgi:hypothetical protein